ncbi:MAG: hypothetical protein ACJAZ2_001813 [Glaciecola sp.]|jgi:hypothetical protein
MSIKTKIMKKVLLVTGALLLTVISIAQKEKQVNIYRPTLEYGEKLFIPMEFGQFDLTNKPIFKGVKADRVLKVEIVCTDFPRGVVLKDLNVNRLKKLKSIFPTLKSNKKVVYQTIRQVEFEGVEEARKMFHGLVITYLPIPTKMSMKKELFLLDQLLNDKPIKAVTYRITKSEKIVSESVADSDEPIMQLNVVNSTAKITVQNKANRLISAPITESDWKGNDTIKNKKTVESLNSLESSEPVYTKDFLARGRSLYYQKDSSVIKVMRRNKSWSKIMIVADLTGSMYAYTAQILKWIKMQSKANKVQSTVFFNDGDGIENKNKIIGKTGGIHQSVFSSFNQTHSLAKQTMRAGRGGDRAENNIEAILKGEKEFPYCQNVVMVADNNANIKDIELMSEISNPVHVILCGVFDDLHVDYLNLALKTGGSVHTMDKSYNGFRDLKEGDSATFEDYTYRIVNGKFRLINQVSL